MKWKRPNHHRDRWRLVTKLMSRDGPRCSICRVLLERRALDSTHPNYITFDHIVPRSRGGTDAHSNLRLAHKACNELRGNDPLVESTE